MCTSYQLKSVGEIKTYLFIFQPLISLNIKVNLLFIYSFSFFLLKHALDKPHSCKLDCKLHIKDKSYFTAPKSRKRDKLHLENQVRQTQ